MQKLVVGCVVLMFVILGGISGGFGEQAPAPQEELRIVDKHPLNWIWIVFNVSSYTTPSPSMR